MQTASNSLETAVLLLVFNRPDTVEQVMDVLQKVQPKRLYIAADGPRKHVLADEELCMATRNIILSKINWPCEVQKLFRQTNLGCGKAVQGALDWFFLNEEEGIILEDDTLPNITFFRFCETMLRRYKDDERFFSINGCNFGYQNTAFDYGITNYFHMWGWATWRRSNHLVNNTWPLFEESPSIFKHASVVESLKLPTFQEHKNWLKYWERIFSQTRSGKINTWDYQWVFSCLKHRRKVIRPSYNLVKNIGFSTAATHTDVVDHPLAYLHNNLPLKFEQSQFQAIEPTISKTFELEFVAKKWAGYLLFQKSKIGQLYLLIKKKLAL